MKLKAKDVLKAYNVLGSAKYGKLDDADKIKLWKIARVLRPEAEKLETEIQSAEEAFKPEGYDDLLLRAQSYERALKNPKEVAEMGPGEYGEFLKSMRAYRKTVNEAMKETSEKEVEVKIETISEDVFVKLMNANDWTLDQVTAIDMITQ